MYYETGETNSVPMPGSDLVPFTDVTIANLKLEKIKNRKLQNAIAAARASVWVCLIGLNSYPRKTVYCQLPSSGSFRVKKWGFERAVSKLFFLALNKLVGPHGVHRGQFWPPPAILGSIFTPGWLFGYVEHPKFQISFWSHFLWFCCPFCIQRDGISPLLMFKVQNRP